MTRYFLDTSAHIERWGGEESVRAEIQDLLGSESHATSTHVLREWKHIVDGGTAELLNAYADGRDSASAFARLSQGWGRRPSQYLRLFSMLTRAGATQIADPEFEIRARQFLRYRSRRWFRHQIDTVRDGSECELAREEVARDSRGRLSLRDTCAKSQCDCRQVEFVGVHFDRWRAAATALASTARRRADKKLGQLGLRVLDREQDRKGKNCYAHLGDLSIAMECGANEVLLTTDESYETICPAIGVSVQRIKATASPH